MSGPGDQLQFGNGIYEAVGPSDHNTMGHELDREADGTLCMDYNNTHYVMVATVSGQSAAHHSPDWSRVGSWERQDDSSSHGTNWDGSSSIYSDGSYSGTGDEVGTGA